MQSQPHFQQKAIKLVSIDQQGKYILHPDGINFLKQIPKPLAVISVAGMYRTGKSYLLNRMLLNRSNGFDVGNTINACTKGLWCWGSPIKGTTPQGQKCNVVVIDTQGIAALDQDQNHDTKIFTLGILAASSFIYNSMGSIDQNALQNLGLIVNLTKNIQLRTYNSQEEEQQEDPDQLASYFPSFYWVVRDFSLQLMTQDGQGITPKEYLQRALAQQNGFSDDVQQKNRIRRLLVSFFKQRQCITMVRPLVKEQRLQKLDTIDFSQLRPDFVQQVLSFRKRILGRVKPKIMKGKQLDGQMYVNLMGSYVTAINQGAVPNIQNAWNYMCREQCNKVLQESYQMFTKNIKQTFQNDFPCPKDHLNSQIEKMKQTSYAFFEKNAVGDYFKDYFIQLKNKIKSKIQKLNQDNQKQSSVIHKNFIMKNFQNTIEKKMRLGEYKTFTEFNKGVTGFYTNILETCPDLPGKQLVYLDFVKKVIVQGAQIFFKTAENSIEKLKTVSQESIKRLQSQFQKNRKNHEDYQKKTNEKILLLQKSNSQLQIKLDSQTTQFKRKIKQLIVQKDKIEESLKLKALQLLNTEQQLQSKIQDLKKKFDQQQIQLNQNNQQWQKVKAINELKIKQLLQQIQQLKVTSKAADIKINEITANHSVNIKQVSIEFQKKILTLETKIKQYKEIQIQLSQKIQDLQDKIQLKQQETVQKENRLKQQLFKKQQELTKSKVDFQNIQNVMKNDIQTEKESLKNQYQSLKKQKEQLDQSLKALKEQIVLNTNQYTKNQAVLSQKIQFLEITIDQLKMQESKIKQQFQIQIKKLEENYSTNMVQMKSAKSTQIYEEYQTKLNISQQENENLKKKLQIQIDLLKKDFLDKQLQTKLKITNLQGQNNSLKELISTLQQQIQTMSAKINEKEQKINQLNQGQQSGYAQKVRQLQDDIQQLKQDHQKQLRQAFENSQDRIKQLKNQYQLEKQTLSLKVVQQKQKFEKKQKQLIEDLQERLNSQTQELRQDNQNLRNDYNNLEITFRQSCDQLQLNYDMVKKNNEDLEKELQELRDKKDKIEKDLLQKLQRLSQNFKLEKKVLQDKVDEFYQIKTKYEKQIMTLTHTKQVLSNTVLKAQQNNKNLLQESKNLKINIECKNEQFRNKIKQLDNQKMQIKINYQKQIALVKQQNDFNSKKLKQIQSKNQSIKEQYESKLRSLKDDMSKDSNHLVQKYKNELTTLEQKHSELKKSYKEVKSSLNQAINTYQKERGIEKEKYHNLQLKIKQFEQLKFSQSSVLNSQISSLKTTLSKQKKDLQDQLNELKKQFNHLESQRNQLVLNYDRQKTLWENQRNFLETNNKKKQLEHAQSINQIKFNLDALKIKSNDDKVKMETQHIQLINKIQKSHKTEIQQLKSTLNKKQLQYQNKISILESQNREIRQKMIFEQQNKAGSQVTIQRRLRQLTEIQKKLISQIQKLKSDKVSSKNDFEKTIQKQKQKYKMKMSQRDQKYKQVNKEKQQLNFKLQSEKAKWSLQKENFNQKMQQMKDTIGNQKRQNQKLKRQMQKLKVQRKCNNKMQTSMHRYNNYSLQKGLSRSSFQQNSQIENRSPLGDMSGYSFFNNQE